MTAQCMGNFGTHKWLYNEFLAQRYGLSNTSTRPGVPGVYHTAADLHLNNNAAGPEEEQHQPGDLRETVWVKKRYIPTDLRSTAPVPRRKLLAPRQLPRIERDWVPLGEASLRNISRTNEESETYVSAPSTRCEDWSTLRQVLPSKGRPVRYAPPNWGTGHAFASPMIGRKQTRFPHLNSPMTRYVDDMHTTNKLFKLH